MIQPGAKNWIDKYLSLVDEGIIHLNSPSKPKDLTKEEFLHNVFFDTGIIFGFPSNLLFYKENSLERNWTLDEEIKFLLFECLLMVYITEKKTLDKEDFIASLVEFYERYENKGFLNVLKLVFKESESVKLENILKGRIHIKSTLKNKLWASYMSNSLIYIDVLAYRSFLLNEKELEETYNCYILGGLNTVAAVSLSDQEVIPEEQLILTVFLEASEMDDADFKVFSERLKNGQITIEDIKIPKDAGNLYKLYLLDMGVLTANVDLSFLKDEASHLNELCKYLNLPEEKLDHSMMIINRFVMKNNHKITFLSDKSSYEMLYSNFSKKWIKVLGRNKDKVVGELKESKELISLVNKSFTQELTEEEKEKVKNQFRDIIKSVPALAIFMLPGGLVLLPIILKIIPDLIPSAFKSNEL